MRRLAPTSANASCASYVLRRVHYDPQ